MLSTNVLFNIPDGPEYNPDYYDLMQMSGFQNMICKKHKQSEVKWSKLIVKKSLTTFFDSREEVQLKGRTIIGGFAVFQLLVVHSVTKLSTCDITFSDFCNSLDTGILICKMLSLKCFFFCETIRQITQ